MDETITISKFEYDNLKYNDAVVHFLVEALKNAARLNYANDGLYFNDSVIDTAVKMLLPDTYAELMKKLISDKQIEQGGADGETL